MSRPEQSDDESDRQDERSHFEPNATLLTFAYDKWFRWSAAVVLLGVACAVLFISKIFVASTPDVDPPLKISLLDKFQAKSLVRSAKSYAAADKPREAVTAWRSAIINNPANLETYRGALDFLIAQPRIQKDQLNLGFLAGQNLLKWTSTNHADVVRYGRFLDRAGIFDYNITILRLLGTNVPVEAAQMLARAYFFENDMKRFGELWTGRSSDLTNIADLRLIGTAWEAAWGPPAGMQAARERIAAARNDLSTGMLASQLQLKIATKLFDLSLYRSALDQLTSRQEDSVSDHVGYWNLLVGAGRTEEAGELAKNYTRAPANASEAARLAAVMDRLGMTAAAIRFIQGQMADFNYSSDLWMLLASLQSKLGDWNQVRQTAIGMRSDPSLGGQLVSYSWYLEGTVEVRLNREEAADQSFANLSGARFASPALAAQVAVGLREFNRPKLAMEILRGLEKDYGKDPSFWFELSIAAHQSRDMEVTALAAAKAYELQPGNDNFANNHAAVLIALRREPEETVKLTLRLLAKTPGSVDRQINHVLALVNNRRINDAEAALRRISPLRLGAEEKSVLNYAWFLINESKGDAGAARRAAAEINRAHLLPPQVEYLDAASKKLGSS